MPGRHAADEGTQGVLAEPQDSRSGLGLLNGIEQLIKLPLVEFTNLAEQSPKLRLTHLSSRGGPDASSNQYVLRVEPYALAQFLH